MKILKSGHACQPDFICSIEQLLCTASWLIPTATDNCGIASLILTGDSYAEAFDLSGNHITQITGIGGSYVYLHGYGCSWTHIFG
jgi:hypothetical protein